MTTGCTSGEWGGASTIADASLGPKDRAAELPASNRHAKAPRANRAGTASSPRRSWQRSRQHRQASRVVPEPDVAVQGERGVVAELGVDRDFTGSEGPQPVKAVEEQPLADTVALRLGEHRQALDKAPPARGPTDRVPDHPVPGPRTTRKRRCWVAFSASRKPVRSSRQKGVKAVASTSRTPRWRRGPARRSAGPGGTGGSTTDLSSRRRCRRSCTSKPASRNPRCSSGDSAPVITRWKPCSANSSRHRRTNSADGGEPSATGTKNATEPSARHGPIRALSLPQRTILPKRLALEGIWGASVVIARALAARLRL